MTKNLTLITIGFFLVLILLVFRNWFVFQPLSSSDWSFLFKENIEEFSFIPTIRPDVYFPLNFFYQNTAKILNIFGFPWPFIERLVWFWPFLVLTIFSSWYLAKTLFPKEKIIQFFPPFIYLFNTYILMVVGGGQMGVAMGYSLTPLVLAMFINRFKGAEVQRGRGLILTGVVLAIQVMFDPRIALATLGATALYLVYSFKGEKTFFSFATPIVIALLFHSFWLLPAFLARGPILPAGHGEAGWVEFLSLADFSNTISLLHPNWPENIFGKVYFMRPEFLVLPIMAFSSLLFLKDQKISTDLKLISTDRNILFFASLALIGSFLAKGSNPPFGNLYIWLFKYFPGMKMFRDPTKFYLLVALAYSILIPCMLKMIFLKIKMFRR